MSTTSKRVLLLSASAGAGHVRAADALLKDFQLHPAIQNGGDVQHWDILKYSTAAFRYIYSKMYLNLINKAPGLLGYVYKKTDTPWKAGLTQAFEKFNAGSFIDAITAYQPDIVVATHFTPPNVMAWLLAKRKLRVQPAIVVTDLDCHALWLSRSYTRYFVSLQETRIYLQRMGINPEKITVSGIPVDPIFRIPRDIPSTRLSLGLDPARPTVLVSAGGFGVGPVESLISELLQLSIPLQVVAIAGKSPELKAKFDRLAKKIPPSSPVQLHPVAFTKQMDEYMAAADILISKPGGLTTAEAMARSLPMCIVNPIPGQEERNSDHLLEAGVAIKCNNPPTLGWKIQQLLSDPPRLQLMRQKARNFGKPQAGQTIVQTLLK